MSAFNTNLNKFSLDINSDNAATNQNCTLTQVLRNKLTLTEHEVALHAAIIVNAAPNITTAYNNTTFSYTSWNNGVTPKSVTVNLLPIGNGSLMSIDDINGAMQTAMLNNGDYLLDNNGNPVYYLNISGNSNLNRVQIVSTPVPTSLPSGWTYSTGTSTPPTGLTLSGTTTNMQVVIPNTGFVSLLGFIAGSYPSTQTVAGSVQSFLSNNIPIISPVSSLRVTCNLVGPSDFTTIPNLLATVPITAAPQEQIIFTPLNLNWTPIPKGDYFFVTITICDQNGNPITAFLDNENAFTLDIRKRQIS